MRPLPAVALLLALAAPAVADETPVKGRIAAVDLFKNGLAVVKYEVTLGKPGTYALDDVPSPVHGTFWVESAAPVEVSAKMRDVEVPADEAGPGQFQDDLAGKVVTVHFKGRDRPPIRGTMAKVKPEKADRDSLPSPDGHRAGEFLVLHMGKGRVFIDRGDVSMVEAADAADKVTRKKPRLLLTLGKTDKAETKVALRYLAFGLTWAPDYRIDISDPKTLSIEQHAVVKNELSDLTDAEVRLISGYPSVQFSHAKSPLDPRVGIAAFFAQMNNPGSRYGAVTLGNSLGQQAVFNNRDNNDAGPALGAIPTGEGVDVHYQPIGKRTLADGEALALTVAAGKAPYERVVEWLVPDHRDESGAYRNHQRDRDHEPGDDDTAWDALRFKNPLKFPMTTGPATVTADGSFNGQRTSHWVNAGEETLLRVEKALSVRTLAVENEKGEKVERAELVWIGSRHYRKATVEGELTVNNHRKEAVAMVIRRRFSGELLKADGDPKASLSAEGVLSVNKRNELNWSLPLKSGEEKKLKYSYSVLVPN